MRYSARTEVSLKPGHIDPEGETTAQLLNELGYKILTVKVSKIYNTVFEANSKEEAEKIAEEMCRRLLANPTKDDYALTIEEG